MVLKIGVWSTEEWVEQAGPVLLEAGFKLVSAGTDPESDGEYQHCVFDYAGEEELEWEAAVSLIARVRSILEPLGQDVTVRIARG